MKLYKSLKGISVICSILGFILSLYGLISGLTSIGASGFGQLGIIFIMPSIFAFIIILLDYLITIDKIKRGLIYSFISSLIKIGFIVIFIPSTLYDYKYEMQYGVSNFDFDLILIVSLLIVTIPSILNIIKLINKKGQEKTKNDC